MKPRFGRLSHVKILFWIRSQRKLEILGQNFDFHIVVQMRYFWIFWNFSYRVYPSLSVKFPCGVCPHLRMSRYVLIQILLWFVSFFQCYKSQQFPLGALGGLISSFDKESCWGYLTTVLPLWGRIYLECDFHNIIGFLSFEGVEIYARNPSRIVHSSHYEFPKKHVHVLMTGFSRPRSKHWSPAFFPVA